MANLGCTWAYIRGSTQTQFLSTPSWEPMARLIFSSNGGAIFFEKMLLFHHYYLKGQYIYANAPHDVYMRLVKTYSCKGRCHFLCQVANRTCIQAHKCVGYYLTIWEYSHYWGYSYTCQRERSECMCKAELLLSGLSSALDQVSNRYSNCLRKKPMRTLITSLDGQKSDQKFCSFT